MKNKLIVAILYILLFSYLYSFQDYGLNIWDEGGYANGTLRTFNGQTALKDFNPNGYLPGRYLYGAFFFRFFGTNIQSLRIGVALLTPAMILMVYAVGRRIMPSGFAFLAALATLSAPAMYYNRFYTIFCVMLMYCLSRLIHVRGAPRFFVLVGAIVVAGFFKLEVALFGAVIGAGMAILLHLQAGKTFSLNIKEGNLVSRFSVPALVLVFLFVPIGIYSIRNELISKVWNIVIETHDVWGNPFPQIFPFWKLLWEIGPHEMFERTLFFLPILTYAAVFLIWLLGIWKRRGNLLEEDLHTLSILSFGVCAFGLVIWRAGFDNLLRTLPPFYILFCFLLFIFWREVRRTQWFRGKGETSSESRLTALNVFIVFLPFMFYYEMNMSHGFYAGSIGAIKKEKGHLQLPRLDVYTHPTEVQWLTMVVSKIKLYTQKGDPIFVIPMNPVFYYLTDRVNPTPYDWILPGMLDETAQAIVVEHLRANPPKIMVYADIPIDGREDRRFARYAPVIFDYIKENYILDELIGFFQILIPQIPEGVLDRPDLQEF